MDKLESLAKHKIHKISCACDPGQREFGANSSE